MQWRVVGAHAAYGTPGTQKVGTGGGGGAGVLWLVPGSPVRARDSSQHGSTHPPTAGAAHTAGGAAHLVAHAQACVLRVPSSALVGRAAHEVGRAVAQRVVGDLAGIWGGRASWWGAGTPWGTTCACSGSKGLAVLGGRIPQPGMGRPMFTVPCPPPPPQPGMGRPVFTVPCPPPGRTPRCSNVCNERHVSRFVTQRTATNETRAVPIPWGLPTCPQSTSGSSM